MVFWLAWLDFKPQPWFLSAKFPCSRVCVIILQADRLPPTIQKCAFEVKLEFEVNRSCKPVPAWMFLCCFVATWTSNLSKMYRPKYSWAWLQLPFNPEQDENNKCINLYFATLTQTLFNYSGRCGLIQIKHTVKSVLKVFIFWVLTHGNTE